MARPCKPVRSKAFSILNHYGDLWTSDHWPTPEAAQAHLEATQRAWGPKIDLSRPRVVPVQVTIRVTPSPQGRESR